MSDDQITNTEDMQRFVGGTLPVVFTFAGKDKCYRWIQHTLVRFHYMTCSQQDKGLISRYLQQVNGYSAGQIKWLIQQYRKTGGIRRRQRTVAGFKRVYGSEGCGLC